MTDDEVIKILDAIIARMGLRDKKIFNFHVGSRVFYAIVNYFNKQSAHLPLVTPAINPIHYKGYTVFEDRKLPDDAIQAELEFIEKRKVTFIKMEDSGEITMYVPMVNQLTKDDVINTFNRIDKEIRNVKLR